MCSQDSQRMLKKLQEQRAKYMYVIKRPNVPSRCNRLTVCVLAGNLGPTIYGYTLLLFKSERVPILSQEQ